MKSVTCPRCFTTVRLQEEGGLMRKHFHRGKECDASRTSPEDWPRYRDEDEEDEE
jgi:hypothetical protein